MTQRGVESLPRLAARWLPLVAVLTGLTVCAALRCLHLANADALLPTLMSTDRLTWFYWGQDRLANLVPLMAVPVSGVRWNFATQMWVISTGWFGLIALASASHQLSRDSKTSPAVVAVSTAIVGALTILLLPDTTLQLFVFEQLYAFALLLYLVGLLAVTRASRTGIALGAVLVVAATMVNPSLLLYTPIVGLFPGIRLRSHAALRALIAAVAAFACATIVSARFGDSTGSGTGYNDFALGRSWDNFADALERIGEATHGWRTMAALAISACVLIGLRDVLDRRLRLFYVAMPLFAVAWVAAFSGNLWVASNQLSARYFFPVFATGLLILTAATTACVLRVAEHLPHLTITVSTRGAAGACLATVLLPALAVWSFARIDIDALVATRPAVAVAREQRVDIVTGDYWSVWPTVIEARAQGLDVLGLAYRANPIVDDLSQRIAAELGRDGAVTVLCLGIGPADCATSLTNWGLTLTRPVSNDPLVVDVIG